MSDREPSPSESSSDRSDPVRPDGGESTRSRASDAEGRVGRILRLPGGSTPATLWWELADRYEPYVTLEKDGRETVRRWGLGSILSHWTLVLLMAVVAGTGFLFWTGWYGPLNVGIWDGYQVSFYLHTWGGVTLAVVALLVFPMYHKFADGHRLLVTPQQLKEQVVITLSFLGVLRYIPGYKQARRTYDENDGEWVGYHPMQTVFWYVTWFFVIALSLTGFALWVDLAVDPAWWLTLLGFMAGWLPYETMLQLHLLATFWVLAAIAIHVYFAVIPSNVDFLRSMVTGTVEAWSVDDDTRPAPIEDSSDAPPTEGTDDD